MKEDRDLKPALLFCVFLCFAVIISCTFKFCLQADTLGSISIGIGITILIFVIGKLFWVLFRCSISSVIREIVVDISNGIIEGLEKKAEMRETKDE